jgi:ATP-dependent RNA helicase RhlE
MSFNHKGRAGFHRARPQRGRSFAAPRNHISKYINTATVAANQPVHQIQHSFEDFGLDQRVLMNISQHGYSTPTPIQDQAIPALMQGRDVVGLANTGTGKTAAFLLPFIHKVLQDPNQGVLILSPTRELALQIFEELKAFARNLSLGVCLCIGGTNLQNQVSRLRDEPHFVIGTPGRLKVLIKRGAFKTDLYTNIVLDEVDRMLDIGFRRDIEFLIAQLPAKKHAAFFSATMDYSTEEIMRRIIHDPVRISVKTQETSNHIEQDVIKVDSSQNKVDILHNLLRQEEFSKVIIFGRTKHGINKLEKQLYDRGVRISSIHGNKTQGARQKSLNAFKSGSVQALLATDIAARGIDIDNVTHVINYDEPQSYQDYIHRIGRTGRAGKAGKALTFVN